MSEQGAKSAGGGLLDILESPGHASPWNPCGFASATEFDTLRRGSPPMRLRGSRSSFPTRREGGELSSDLSPQNPCPGQGSLSRRHGHSLRPQPAGAVSLAERVAPASVLAQLSRTGKCWPFCMKTSCEPPRMSPTMSALGPCGWDCLSAESSPPLSRRRHGGVHRRKSPDYPRSPRN
jgi:hypothetical protein